MSTTDPLREALIGGDPLDPRWTWLSGAAERLREHAPADEDPDAMYECGRVLETLYAAIGDALAAVPVEPEPEYDATDDTTEVPCGMCRGKGIDKQSATAEAVAVACPWCDGTKTILALGRWVQPVEPEAWEPRPGEMHPVDQAFYDTAIRERDFERARGERLMAELATARGRLDALRSEPQLQDGGE